MFKVQQVLRSFASIRNRYLPLCYPPNNVTAIRSYSDLQYDSVYKRSVEQPEEFWAEVSQNVDWFKPWTKVLDLSNSPAQKW